MKISKHNIGLNVGAIFTVISLLLTFTFFVPIISIIPGLVFESIAKKIISNIPYSNVGKLTIVLLFLITFLALIFSLLWVKKTVEKNKEISKGSIVVIFFFLYFLVHSLAFYIYWGAFLDFRGDGQLIFSAIISHPFSSFSFVLIGILIDFVKNKYSSKPFETL